MPFVPAPRIVMHEFRYTVLGQKCENRIHIDYAHEPDSSEVAAMNVVLWNWWENTYAPHISDSVLLREVVGTDVSMEAGFQRVYAPDTSTTGAVTGEMMPNEVSLCLSLRSGYTGRSARGRWYVVGIPRSVMADANNVNTTFAGNMTTDLNALNTAIQAEGAFWTIVSYFTNNAPRVGGPVYYVVQTVTLLDTIVDSQRRRKPGVGE